LTFPPFASAQFTAAAAQSVVPSHSVRPCEMLRVPRTLPSRIEQPGVCPNPPHTPETPTPSLVSAAAIAGTAVPW
jgi:hypothetical protein